MKIATFNINSINARIETLSNWLKKENPDVVLLQEIKTDFNNFPFFELQILGYEAKVLGQKSYNGVAVLSRHKMQVITEGLPQFEDENSRYLEVDIEYGAKKIRCISLYLPNGNPPYNNPDDNTKFDYKLKWMDALYMRLKELKNCHIPIILGGDYNVILTKDDVYNVEEYKNNALYRKEVRERMNAILHLGYYDAFRLLNPVQNGYTFWDYSGGAWANDLGMRIDYFLLSPLIADKISKCWVDKSVRAENKPSDHTPLILELSC